MKRRRWTVVPIVGTRPNVMKVAPVVAELARRDDRFDSVLVHIGGGRHSHVSLLWDDRAKEWVAGVLDGFRAD